MSKKKNDLGHITVEVGSDNERKIPVDSWMRAMFNDERVVSIHKITEDGAISYALYIDNPEESGRSSQELWLSEDSMIALMTLINMFYHCEGTTINDVLNRCMDGREVVYAMSDNLEDRIKG